MARMFERQDHRSFHITPRYWDPEKEEREERSKKIKEELGIKEENKTIYVPDIRGRFTNLYQKKKENRKGYNGHYAVRFFLILIVIFIGVLYMITRYSEGIFHFLGM